MRWLPGSDAATYCAQADEHNSIGTEESSLNPKLQMEKRLRKFDGLKALLPEPHLSVGGRSANTTDWMDAGDEIELLAIGWGSTGDAIQDVMCSDELRGRKIAYLHYTYLWPLRTQELQRLARRSKRIVLVEQNYQGQLGMLIRMECGLDIPDKILKYDGRPFFYDELLSSVMERCVSTAKTRKVFPDSNMQVPHHEYRSAGPLTRCFRVLFGDQMRLV